jgi:hypothetical protein
LKIMNCAEKLHHKTERLALDHLAWARKQRHQEGSHGLKHLNVYECPCKGGWCVGRAWRSKREAQAVQPKAEPSTGLTSGQQRRAAKKAAEKADRQAQFADYHQTLQFCKMLVDRELARYEALGIKPRALMKEV